MNPKVTIITPPESHAALRLAQLWEFRELIYIFALRDIKVRYKQTALGVVWAVIQPITVMLIFTLLFGRLAKIPSDGVPYPVFVFSGLLMWNFFSAGISSCSNSLVGSSAMISKVYFPRMVIPISSVAVSMVDFVVSAVVLLLLMAFYGITLNWQLLLLPVLVLGLFTSVLGLGLWLSAITVTFRDFRFVVPFMIQIWMYVTPVIYPISFIPEQFRWLIYLNPVVGWVTGARSVFLGTQIDWLAIGASFVISGLMFVIGVRYFNNAERRFADVV